MENPFVSRDFKLGSKELFWLKYSDFELFWKKMEGSR